MSNRQPNIQIPVDLTNPGQFFACCGLLELADRLWPGAEGWFAGDDFHLGCGYSINELLSAIASLDVSNTMLAEHRERMRTFTAIRNERKLTSEEEVEESILDGMRRKAAIVLSGQMSLRIDWFCDPFTRGFSLKTWAGQQSVLTIATDMHRGLIQLSGSPDVSPWASLRDIGLPFMFDGEIGAQGSGRDVGFVFDAFKGKRHLEITRGCRPILEFLSFVGLQRFRPLELSPGDRFRYASWAEPLPPSIAAVVASTAVRIPKASQFLFQMFNRNKDYYSFYPAQPLQGDRDE